MICGGVSVIGSYHIINQDWYSTFSDNTVSVIAVSDGVGSKKHSHIGAEAICRVVVEEAKKCSMEAICSDDFILNIQKRWQKSIGDHEIESCCCTVMFCIAKDGKVFLAQLGDGIAGIVNNSEVIVFYDDDENHYINETDCLTETINTEKWRMCCVEKSEDFGAVLCTDGIGIFPEAEDVYKQFVKEFVSEYSKMSKTDILDSIRKWVSEWSGYDDKTLAFMIMEGNRQ